ncbi:MAG: DUF4886 domain-containing protein [Oscillospiraceae bacterium]|nr:DUF4886 domain-containing protein [Oscillospiraceae bacterium]
MNTQTDTNRKGLKVLAIGNSNTVSATRQLCPVADSLGLKDFTLRVLYRGDSDLETHIHFARSGEPGFLYFKPTVDRYYADPNDLKKFSVWMGDEDWDIIVLQQGSISCGFPEEFQPWLDETIEIVKQHHPKARLMFHMMGPYAQDCKYEKFGRFDFSQEKMYRKICDSVQQVILPHPAFEKLIPSGTMMQSLRSSSYGDGFHVDDRIHLNRMGEYATAVMWYSVLTGQPVDQLTYHPEDVPAEFMEQVKILIPKVLAAPFTLVDCSHF